MPKPHTIAVLGAGSWGTSVAIHLARLGHPIYLWAHREEQVAAMIRDKENQRYLPNVAFPSNLYPTASLQTTVSIADDIIIAVPSHAFLSIFYLLPKRDTGIAWITKGIDPLSTRFFSSIIEEHWGDISQAFISGPSFAKEVARGLPTALTITGNHKRYQAHIRSLFHHHNIRTYLTSDLIGVQLAGAVKNVLAIACGVSDGLGFGANAKAALITRGLAEMTRLGLALGAQQSTFMGLAGLGDLVLTCTDDQSRNRRFGLRLGLGDSVAVAESDINQVIEGKHNAAQVLTLAKQYHIDMPICKSINLLLTGECTPIKAVNDLMNRPPKEE